MLPRWYVKDPGHSAKSTDGRLPLNTHTLLTYRSRMGLTMPLSRNSVEPIKKRAHTQLVWNTRPQSTQIAEPPWTEPGIKSGISVRKLMSTLKKRRRRGMNGRTFSQDHRKRGKSQRKKHSALRPQKPLRLIRDGEVGGSGILYLTPTRYTVTTRMTPH